LVLEAQEGQQELLELAVVMVQTAVLAEFQLLQ
jgi:hypothetical protein